MSVLIDGQLTPPPGLKGGTRQGTGKKAFRFAELPDPIPAEIRDTKEIQQLLKTWRLVPYAGTMESTGDALRNFFSSMTYLSSTHGACIASKKRFSLGKFVVRRRQDVDFDLGQEDTVQAATQSAFVEFLKTIETGGLKLRNMAISLYEDWEEVGDQFCEVVISEALGVKSYAIHRHRPANVKYLATGKGEQRWVAISPIWKEKYLKENPPAVVPIYPAFEVEPDGTMRTMLHRKNGKNEWYGRPPAWPAWMFWYREYQDASYLVKMSNSNFTGQVIIEVEDDNPDLTDEDARRSGYTSEADRIHKNFTHEADDPMTVWYSSRPTGARPMFVHEVKPNTAQDFYRVMDQITEAKIIRAHGWSKRLMEAEEGAGLSSNVFMDLLKSRLPVINGVQEDASAILNQAIAIMVADAGRKDLENIGISFKSPFQEIIDQTEDEPEQ